jgi:hypothetical protein
LSYFAPHNKIVCILTRMSPYAGQALGPVDPVFHEDFVASDTHPHDAVGTAAQVA